MMMVFKILSCLFVKKFQNEVSACFYEITLFGAIVPAIRLPPVTLKVVPKAACDSENCSESRNLM
jgi:hypothetical protein